MSRKTNRSDNNFKKAVNEPLGYPVSEDLDVGVFETEGPQFFDMSDNDEDEETTYSTASSAVPYQNVEAAASTVASDLIPEPVQQERTSYVTESIAAADMEIMGNVSSSSNTTISGHIIGNAVCRGSVLTGGEAGGDISAAEMEIWGSVSSNITMAGKVIICNGAQIKGDIIVHEVITGGVSEGDVEVKGKAVLRTSSVITGSIYARTFGMSVGIKTRGLAKTHD